MSTESGFDIRPEHLNSHILLFPRHIREIEIIVPCQGVRRRMVRSEVSKTSKCEIHEITEYANGGAVARQDQGLERANGIISSR